MTTDPFTVCKYGADAEGTHDFAGIHNFNESVYFNFVDPVSQLGGLVRIGNRPNLGYSETSVQLTLPGGAIAFRAGRRPCETNDEFAGQGLEIVIKEPTRTAEITYRNTVARVAHPSMMAEQGRLALKNAPSEECEISLTYEATSPMFVINGDGDGDCTPGSSTIASDHYEQFGHLSGTIRVGSRTWVLDKVTSFRDHSWGPREWASYTGEWLAGWLADGTAFSAYGEYEPSGVRVSAGAVMTTDHVAHPITDYKVLTDYAGESTYNGRHVGIITAVGLPTIVVDGSIRHFVPVTQRTEDRAVRMAQMTVDLAEGHGGWAVAEFLRPIRP
ncbi:MULTISPECIES: hypothetical protein [Rhodococcus]|uniref:DUF7065 domain-containing protein n=1 Tax=Rhodococcus TaxID=1827 RepID=UPI00163ACAC6|nr:MULTISPECIES: hypothetical protein [Rhodococcus]MBC2589698.1 hypothetical protein [Rhodococcus aetherivorans]QRI77324.1 hypothetical protein JQ505_06050 [Rhodococcus aetherivorans]QSE60744.1 hypothetical protein JYA75_07165 [Rhodococcus sp. PSBB066]QSE67948.1 hypothetical protein JYA91_20430 [Rhodococcus sp. PSBB049]